MCRGWMEGGRGHYSGYKVEKNHYKEQNQTNSDGDGDGKWAQHIVWQRLQCRKEKVAGDFLWREKNSNNKEHMRQDICFAQVQCL